MLGLLIGKGYVTFDRARIAQSVEHQTFNLRVQGSSPCSGVVHMLASVLKYLESYVALEKDVPEELVSVCLKLQPFQKMLCL